MEKRKEELIFPLVILSGVTWALIVTLKYPFKAMIFPFIALLIAFILLGVEIVRNILHLRTPHPVDSDEKEEKNNFTARHLHIGLWMLSLPLMLWLIGFVGTVIFFPFFFLRLQRESWMLSLVLPLSCGIFFYAVFSLLLSLPLYPGVVVSILLG